MHSLLQSKLLRTGAAALALALPAVPAQAQQKPPLALDCFAPAPAGDRMFGVQSPFVAGELAPHAMILADYAHDPLVLHTTSGDKNLGAVVSNQMFLHLNAGVALFSRLNVNLDAPIALVQTGDSPKNGAESFPSPSKVQFGDLRLGLRVRLLGEYHDPFQLAIGGYVWFPTGPHASGSFVGTGTVRGLPQLIVGGQVADRIVYSAAVGPEIGPAQDYANVGMGTNMTWGAGVGVLLLPDCNLQIGPKMSGSVVFRDVQKRTTSAELLIDARYRFLSDFEVGIGAGPGLTSGIGTPDVRGIFMLAYTPEMKRDRDRDGIVDREDACPDEAGPRNDDPKKNGCPPADRDFDGILDEVDACPDVPGESNPDPKKNGCPPPGDRDGDGILDDVDACPDEKGVPNEDPKKHGCPVRDRDGDKILDDVDACPDEAGVPSEDPKKNGCPVRDRDGDGIPDDVDACPDEKGPADPDPKKNGCPLVHIKGDEIVIGEQVQFDTGKSTIKPVSDALLDKVAAIFKDHPEILKVEVQGHTDDKGAPALNKGLSARRADAVKKALMKRGIMARRLTSQGYGQDKPIADNKTEAGRALNRRVQFQILEKGSADKAPPPDQPKKPKAHKVPAKPKKKP